MSKNRFLSADEYEALSLVIQGLRPKQMQDRLGIGLKGVCSRLARARAKLGANSTAHAAVLFDRMNRE